MDTDAGSRRYVDNVKNRLFKNYHGGLDDLKDGGGMMYEKPV